MNEKNEKERREIKGESEASEKENEKENDNVEG